MGCAGDMPSTVRLNDREPAKTSCIERIAAQQTSPTFISAADHKTAQNTTHLLDLWTELPSQNLNVVQSKLSVLHWTHCAEDMNNKRRGDTAFYIA